MKGNVIIEDLEKNYTIFAEKVNYNKNKEIIKTKDNSKLVLGDDGNISANTFEYQRINDVIIAQDKVKITNKLKDYEILAEEINYFREIGKIISQGKTKVIFYSKFIFNSEDIDFSIKDNLLSSNKKTRIQDSNSQAYFVDKFNYNINEKFLKEKIYYLSVIIIYQKVISCFLQMQL